MRRRHSLIVGISASLALCLWSTPSLAQSFGDAVLASEPAHYWQLNEASAPAGDSAGTNDMSVVGGAVSMGEPGLFPGTGTAYRFDEQEGIANGLRGASTLHSGGQALTFEVVVRWDGPRPGIGGLFTDLFRYAAITQNRPGNPNGSGVRIAVVDEGEGVAHFEISLSPGAHTGGDGGLAIAPELVEVGRAYHVVGAYDGVTGTLTLYVDGIQVVTDTVTPGSLHVPDVLGRIGWELEGGTGFGTRSWHGAIDEVAVYHRVLGAEEVLAHYTWLVPLAVAIDIKPGSDPNSINLGSNGVVPVAILSSPDFDATTIDPTTVTLAGATVRLRGRGAPQASVDDVNGDGLDDLVVHVDTTELELTDGDTEAVLEGETPDGRRFVGVNSVNIVP